MSPLEKSKRQQRWMLPVLAALFVLNFAAFVNARLVPANVAVQSMELAEQSVLDGYRFEIRSNFDQPNYRILLKSPCESDRRHVHVRTW